MYPSQQHYPPPPPRSENTVLLNFTNYEGVYCLTDTLLSNRVTPVLAAGEGGYPILFCLGVLGYPQLGLGHPPREGT